MAVYYVSSLLSMEYVLCGLPRQENPISNRPHPTFKVCSSIIVYQMPFIEVVLWPGRVPGGVQGGK